MAGFRATLDAADSSRSQTPKLVAAATEGGANVFPVDYFGRPAFLAQSPQFYKQIMVGVFERVYEVGPVFRAEPHDTARHLKEYVSLDAELGFIGDHPTSWRCSATYSTAWSHAMRERAARGGRRARARLPDVPERHSRGPLHRSADDDRARDRASRSGEPDLAPAHERWLGEWAAREHGSDFLFVSGYPMAKRPFYTHPDPSGPRTRTASTCSSAGWSWSPADSGSIATTTTCGRSQVGISRPFAGYLEAFQHGMPPHGGFAIGLERWVARVIGADNVRETTLFPRDLYRLTP